MASAQSDLPPRAGSGSARMAVGRMPLMRRLAVLLAASGLAGCSGFSLNPLDWFGASPPPPAPLVQIANPIPVRVLWQASVGKAELETFTPAVAAGSVFAAAADGTIVRLDAATGRQVWRVRVPARLSGGVGADGKLVVVGST